MLTYTVIGFYTDNNQPFVISTSALNPDSAERSAVEEALELNGWDRDYADEIRIVTVLEGSCFVAKKPWEVSKGCDILNGVEITHCEVTSYVG